MYIMSSTHKKLLLLAGIVIIASCNQDVNITDPATRIIQFLSNLSPNDFKGYALEALRQLGNEGTFSELTTAINAIAHNEALMSDLLNEVKDSDGPLYTLISNMQFASWSKLVFTYNKIFGVASSLLGAFAFIKTYFYPALCVNEPCSQVVSRAIGEITTEIETIAQTSAQTTGQTSGAIIESANAEAGKINEIFSKSDINSLCINIGHEKMTKRDSATDIVNAKYNQVARKENRYSKLKTKKQTREGNYKKLRETANLLEASSRVSLPTPTTTGVSLPTPTTPTRVSKPATTILNMIPTSLAKQRLKQRLKKGGSTKRRKQPRKTRKTNKKKYKKYI